jgi:hypothetical protein
MKVVQGNPLTAVEKLGGEGDGENRIEGINLTNAQQMHV